MVLALPRGGVPVGFEVARALDAPLDVVLVRKLGAPGHGELAIGAIADGDQPFSILNDAMLLALEVPQGYLDRTITSELAEIRRRETTYRGGRVAVSVQGRTALVVDDGLATGSTMRVALRSVRRAEPARVILAVPVAPADELAALASEADDVVCLMTPDPFHAVGCFYRDFTQTTDAEVVRLLDAARRGDPDEPRDPTRTAPARSSAPPPIDATDPSRPTTPKGM